MARKPDPKSKAGFVRSLPSSISAADAVARAKVNGIRLTVNYVYKIRGSSVKRATSTSGTAPVATTAVTATSTGGNGLVYEIESIVEAKVNALLKQRLGVLFGR